MRAHSLQPRNCLTWARNSSHLPTKWRASQKPTATAPTAEAAITISHGVSCRSSRTARTTSPRNRALGERGPAASQARCSAALRARSKARFSGRTGTRRERTVRRHGHGFLVAGRFGRHGRDVPRIVDIAFVMIRTFILAATLETAGADAQGHGPGCQPLPGHRGDQACFRFTRK